MVTQRHTAFAALAVLALLAVACVHPPSGPSVMALPGSGTSFGQFTDDDARCREWAYRFTGGETPTAAAERAGVASAAIGTGLGAAAGAAIGAAVGDPGTGAAIGAGSGLLMGSAAGAERAAWIGGEVQQRYDSAYMQCMYAKGNKIPVPRGSLREYPPPQSGPAPPPRRRIPAPPPGAPPPPPPDVG